MKTLLFTVLYCNLMPIIPLIGIIGILIFYAFDKYFLLRVNKRPPQLSDKLNKKMVSFYLRILIVCYSVGAILSQTMIFKDVYPITIIEVSLSIIFFFLPNKILDKIIFKEKSAVKKR